MIKHFYNKSDKAHWHKVRDEVSGLGNPDLVRFGASTVSSIMGKNKWQPKTKTFWNCLGKYLDKPYTETTANGLMIEPFIKLRYQTYSPNPEDMVDNMINMNLVNKLDDIDFILTNDKYPNLFCSLDFIKPKGEVRFDNGEVLQNDTAVDTKAVKHNVHQAWNGQLPIYYLIQAQVQQMMLDSDYSEMCVLVEGERLVIYPCEKDQRLRDQILWATDDFALQVLKAKKVQQFIDDSKSQEDREMYEEVLQGLEPSIDYTESETALLYDQWSEPSGDFMKGTKTSDLWANRYLKCNTIIALADKYKTFSKNQLLSIIKDSNGALTDDFKVSRVAKNDKPLFKVTKNK